MLISTDTHVNTKLYDGSFSLDSQNIIMEVKYINRFLHSWLIMLNGFCHTHILKHTKNWSRRFACATHGGSEAGHCFHLD